MEETATVEVVAQEAIVNTQEAEQVNIQQEELLDQRMAFAFSDGDFQQQNNGSEEGAAGAAAEIAKVEVLDTKQETVNPFADFGFESAEQLKTELEMLRAKSTTPEVKDYEFANEESKQIAQIINEGKLADLKKWVDSKLLTSNLDSLGQEEKLKLYLRMQNPKFDNELINDEYASLYSFDEEKDDLLDKETGKVDPIKLRKEKLRLEQRIENDLEKANEYFASQSTKVQLPSISVPQVTENKDYEEHMASVAKANEFTEKVIIPQTNSLKEEDLKMSFEVNDPKAQMNFRISVIPTKEHLEKAKDGVLNLTDLIRSIAYDENGTYNPVKAAQFVLKNQYFDEYVKSVAKQAVNAERVSKIAERKNGGNGQRDFSVGNELSDVDKMMQSRMS